MAFSLTDYTDLQELSMGGMGKLFVATQRSLGRKVAIKQMSPVFVSNPALVARFENEAKSAAALDHENIIRVYDFGEDAESFYISMEFVDGPDLDRLIKSKAFPREIGLMVALQAIKGLHYAHSRDIVHRDIKPGNILISRSGLAKVVDFGLAQVLAESRDHNASDSIVGTPLFMSPEQVKGSAVRDNRIDIFAVGVLLYKLSTGLYPFAGSSVPEILQSILYSDPRNIRDLNPVLPDSTVDIIMRSLAKQPDQRPESLAPLMQSLQSWFFEMGVVDIQQTVGDYLRSRQSGKRDYLRPIVAYHVKKGHEFSDSGIWHKSEAHLREALLHVPGDGEITRMLRKIEQRTAIGKPPSVSPPSRKESPEPLPPPEQNEPVKQSAVLAGKGKLVALVSALVLVITTVVLFFSQSGKGEETSASTQTTVESVAGKATETATPEDEVDTRAADSVQTTETETETEAEAEAVAEAAEPKKPKSPAPSPTTEKPRVKETVSSEKAIPEPKKETPSKTRPPQPSEGILKIGVEPDIAWVLLDGETLSSEEMRNGKKVSPGRHVVKASAEGYEAYHREITVEKNATQIMSILMQPKAPATGGLHVHSYPWAKVYVDGKFIGNSPTPKPIMLDEGTHSVVLKREGFEDYSEEVVVEGGRTTRLKARLSADSSGQ